MHISKSGAKTHVGLFLAAWLCFSLLTICREKFTVWLVTNIVETQLQTGEFELITVRSAVQDSGILDVALEDDEQVDDDTVEVQGDGGQGGNRNNNNNNNNNNKCHLGTQTELLSLFPATNAREITESVGGTYF